MAHVHEGASEPATPNRPARMYGLVRDRNRRPKIDDPRSLHPLQVMMLTKAERVELDIWPEALVVDAEGVKRARRLPNGSLVAVDRLVAASEVYDDQSPNGERITPRRDVPPDGVI